MSIQKISKQQTGEPEIWKDIPGYEGYYRASSFGRVIGLEREVPRPIKGMKFTIPGRIISTKKNKKGYWCITLCKNNKRYHTRIHRLVALAWVPNPHNLPEVNHEDGDKDNNRPGNLGWTTRKGNMEHAKNNDLLNTRTNERHELSKRVRQSDLNGDLVKEWPSVNETGRNGFVFGSVAKACRESRIYKNFRWQYV
jgi:hypothetical protein